MSSTSKTATAPDVSFDGSNWEDLSRLATLARLHRKSGTDVDSEATQSTWVARQFTGAALDWVTTIVELNASLLDNFAAFIDACRTQFGITDELLQNHQRAQLDSLTWRKDAPTFFAEFDRLTLACGLGADNSGKITLLMIKLPLPMRTILAHQNYVPSSYTDLRKRLLTLWTLDPKSPGVKQDKAAATRPRCGRCGRKGHVAAECRSSASVKQEKT